MGHRQNEGNKPEGEKVSPSIIWAGIVALLIVAVTVSTITKHLTTPKEKRGGPTNITVKGFANRQSVIDEVRRVMSEETERTDPKYGIREKDTK